MVMVTMMISRLNIPELIEKEGHPSRRIISVLY
jgi:hypothetical protein